MSRVPQIPSLDTPVDVEVVTAVPDGMPVGGFVPTGDDPPPALGTSRAQLDAAGFTGKAGAVHVAVSDQGTASVAVALADAKVATLRDAAALVARALAHRDELAVLLPAGIDAATAAQAVVEGAVLARYRYDALRAERGGVALRRIVVIAPDHTDAARSGADRGRIIAAAVAMARDLANTPHSHLTATDLADIAARLGPDVGLGVEVFGKEQLAEMGIGGLLCINAGSSEPPRMIKLTYRPPGATGGGLAMVGKGVMYDSGGISLKPSDRVHAQMKNDMSGAAAVLASMLALPQLGCTTAVTGYLMCTDNMPSGTATGLGDVITIRGGTTVEMIDTDAEGRVIMADALVLAGEDGHDAVVDIATLTGSAMRALGTDMAAVFANDDSMLAQAQAAAAATDELVWQLPLHEPYLAKLDSLVADICNCAPIGQPDALLAALFLARFAGSLPWVHIDMCGQAQNDSDRTWHPLGCTGWGTRLLIQLAIDFTAPVDAAT